MITKFFTPLKHDFTHLGWADGLLGRTLILEKNMKVKFLVIAQFLATTIEIQGDYG